MNIKKLILLHKWENFPILVSRIYIETFSADRSHKISKHNTFIFPSIRGLLHHSFSCKQCYRYKNKLRNNTMKTWSFLTLFILLKIKYVITLIFTSFCICCSLSYTTLFLLLKLTRIKWTHVWVGKFLKSRVLLLTLYQTMATHFGLLDHRQAW